MDVPAAPAPDRHGGYVKHVAAPADPFPQREPSVNRLCSRSAPLGSAPAPKEPE
ncbi:hypothetical protein CZ771_05600 [Actinomycetales bacterium JB111]|nr:hypothetical protein CZ771_05600 [Actinomycetales bacterium JB111]